MSVEREQIKTLTIRNADIIEKIDELAVIHKDPDEAPNPHKMCRRILREASNALLHYKDLYVQLMDTIARLEEQRKEKIA